jgi:hypothetical protein
MFHLGIPKIIYWIIPKAEAGLLYLRNSEVDGLERKIDLKVLLPL